MIMKLEGGCYCRAIRFVAEGEPLLKAQCHCRECQYITGGSANVFVTMPAASFNYTKGLPKQFTRTDIENAVTREFCATCGTHLATRLQGRDVVVVKVGSLDDPSLYGTPDIAIFTIDKQSFHHIPEAMPAFERRPAARR
jgi:hypothetical protein